MSSILEAVKKDPERAVTPDFGDLPSGFSEGPGGSGGPGRSPGGRAWMWPFVVVVVVGFAAGGLAARFLSEENGPAGQPAQIDQIAVATEVGAPDDKASGEDKPMALPVLTEPLVLASAEQRQANRIGAAGKAADQGAAAPVGRSGPAAKRLQAGAGRVEGGRVAARPLMARQRLAGEARSGPVLTPQREVGRMAGRRPDATADGEAGGMVARRLGLAADGRAGSMAARQPDAAVAGGPGGIVARRPGATGQGRIGPVASGRTGATAEGRADGGQARRHGGAVAGGPGGIAARRSGTAAAGGAAGAGERRPGAQAGRLAGGPAGRGAGLAAPADAAAQRSVRRPMNERVAALKGREGGIVRRTPAADRRTGAAGGPAGSAAAAQQGKAATQPASKVSASSVPAGSGVDAAAVGPTTVPTAEPVEAAAAATVDTATVDIESPKTAPPPVDAVAGGDAAPVAKPASPGVGAAQPGGDRSTAAASAVEDVEAAQEVAAAPIVIAKAADSIPAPAAVIPKVPQESQPVVEEEPAPKPWAAPPAGAPSVELLFIVWAEEPAQRMVSMRVGDSGVAVAREGESVNAGLRVASIFPDGVEMMWTGRTYRVDVERF